MIFFGGRGKVFQAYGQGKAFAFNGNGPVETPSARGGTWFLADRVGGGVVVRRAAYAGATALVAPASAPWNVGAVGQFGVAAATAGQSATPAAVG